MGKKRITAGPIDPTRVYSDPELCQFFQWAPTMEARPYWRDGIFLVRLILGTGLRINECLGLRVPDDTGLDGVMIVRRGKTERSKRRVKASPELLPYYRARLQQRAERRLIGEARTTRTMENWWDDCMAAAGIPKIHKRGPHGGRHSWATWELASRRLNLTEVQAQLGHVDPAMTMGFYAHAIVELMYNENKTPAWWGFALPEQRLTECHSY